jgi:hypothetical protein
MKSKNDKIGLHKKDDEIKEIKNNLKRSFKTLFK